MVGGMGTGVDRSLGGPLGWSCALVGLEVPGPSPLKMENSGEIHPER